MDEDSLGVPAGWYPDPLGLPQLRWWDSRAWTQHTSEARAPSTEQSESNRPEELPSRRERRTRERGDEAPVEHIDELVLAASVARAEAAEEDLDIEPLLAMTLRGLQPPVTDLAEGDDSAGRGDTDAAEQAPGPRRASSHNATATNLFLAPLSDEKVPSHEALENEPRERSGSGKRSSLPPPATKKIHTLAVWIIAVMPVLQTLVTMALVLSGLGHNQPLWVVAWCAPYVVVFGLAAIDRLALLARGYRKPASLWWSLLGAPVFLLVRGINTRRAVGRGFAALVTFCVALIAFPVGAFIVPGVAIAVFPSVFAAEISRVVEQDARSFGSDIVVKCQEPPLIVGEVIECWADSASGGKARLMEVELVRQSGWINWRVVDGGDFREP